MSRTPWLVLSLLGLHLLSIPSASSEPRCSEKVFTAKGAPGLIHFTGRRNASNAWSAKVRDELGPAYATWDRATKRRMDCAVSDRRFVCSAVANPCRSIVDGRM